MIDFTGFASGYQQRGDANQGKRREMAEAFAKFKADNPYATQADFQSFIDQYSGGRNYIAGGAPSSEILASLAENNLRAKQLNEANQNLDMFNKQNESKKKVTELIDQALLALPEKNGNVDFTNGALEFQKQYGDLLNNDNPYMKGFNLSDRFNSSRRNLLVSKQIQEFLPQAYTLIERSNGEIDDNSLQMMGVPASLVSQVKDATQTKYKQDQQTRMFNIQGKLIDRALNMIRSGSPLTEDAIGMMAQANGINVTAPEAKKFLANIKSEAERMRSIENTKIDNDRSDRQAKIKIEFRQALEKDELFIRAIRAGNQADAKKRIAYYTQEYQPETRDFLISAGDALISDFENSLQLLQTDLLGEKRNKADKTSLTVLQAYPKNNMAKAEAHFGSVAKPNPNAGAQGGNAVLATQDLAKAFDLNTSTLVLLQEVYKNAPPGSDRATLVSLGQQALQANGADTVTTAKQQLRSTTTLSQGGFGRPETFENWKNTTSETITKHFTSVDTQLDKIMAMPMQTDADKQKVIRQLNHLQAVSMQGVNAISQNISFAEKFSIGKDTWITYGTPQWDGTKVKSELTDKMGDRFKNMTSVINAALEEVNLKTVSVTAKPNILNPDETKPSVLSQWWDKTVSQLETKRKLMQTQTKSGKSASLFGQVFNDPDTVKKDEIISLFMQAPGLKDALIKSPSELQKFNSDPFNYIYTSDLGKKWLDSAGKEYKDYRLQ